MAERDRRQACDALERAAQGGPVEMSELCRPLLPRAAVFADGVALRAAAGLDHLDVLAPRQLDGSLMPADHGEAIAGSGGRGIVRGQRRGGRAGLLVSAAAFVVVVGVDPLGGGVQ